MSRNGQAVAEMSRHGQAAAEISWGAKKYQLIIIFSLRRPLLMGCQSQNDRNQRPLYKLDVTNLWSL